MSRIITTLILLSLAMPFSHAAEIVDFGPFYQKVQIDDQTHYRIGGPFYEKVKGESDETVTRTIRPFYYTTTATGSYAKKETDWLWPLCSERFFNDWQRRRWLLFGKTQKYPKQGDLYRSTWLIPFYWHSVTNDTDHSWLFFPIWGEGKNLMGADYYKFWFLPIYFENQSNDVKSVNWFWPIYKRSDGEHYKQRRYFPFYGYVQRRDRYNSFIMWPFYHHQHSLREDTINNMTMIWPFYGWGEFDSSRRHVKSKSVLWPIYNQYQATTKIEPIQTHTSTRLFPFYYHQDDEKTKHVEKNSYWPFYGITKGEHESHEFFLWPLGSRDTYQARPQRPFSQSTRFFPFYFNRIDIHGKQVTRYFPFSREATYGNHRRFSFPCLIPIEKQEILRAYEPIWTLYESESNDDFTSRRALWGFFQQYQAESIDHYQIFPFYTRTTTNEKKETSILKGLFRKTTQNDQTNYTLFWFINF